MSPEATNILLAIIGFLLTVLVFIAGAVLVLWVRNLDQKRLLSSLNSERIDKIEDQLLLLDFQVTPMWANLQKQVSGELHHPHVESKEADHLIEKLENLTITPKETKRLKKLFIDRSKDESGHVTDREKSLAKIMPTIMDLVLVEAAIEGELEDTELVGVKKEGTGE